MTAAAAGQGPKARPILMSAPMVRALIDGRKTQTRRIVKPQPEHRYISGYGVGRAGHPEEWTVSRHPPTSGDWNEWKQKARCPYGRPGDVLWCRETWQKSGLGWGSELPLGKLHYRATDTGEWKPYWGNWKPSIHMPRHASRLTLDLIGVRVERLQDISEADARAEGLATLTKDNGRTWKFGIPDADGLPGNDGFGWHWQQWEVDPRKAYARLWESINGAGSWAANPWVWVLQFEVHHQNVDALIQQRRAAA